MCEFPALVAEELTMTSKRKHLVKQRLLLLQENRCAYCRKSLSLQRGTLDHLTPKSRGGLTTEENLVVACKICNRAKSNLLLSEWMENILNVIRLKADL